MQKTATARRKIGPMATGDSARNARNRILFLHYKSNVATEYCFRRLGEKLGSRTKATLHTYSPVVFSSRECLLGLLCHRILLIDISVGKLPVQDLAMRQCLHSEI